MINALKKAPDEVFMHQHGSSNQPQPNRFSLPIKLVLYATIGIIAYFLITEHWAHLAGYLPFSLLFICIFMHLFMHGGHGGDNNPPR
jgi:Protein of unknown function (DUF2933)